MPKTPENNSSLPTIEELVKAKVHYGHSTNRWHPNMQPYIFKKHKNMHLIDLYATQESLETARYALKNIAKRNKKIWFISTKKQAKLIIEKVADELTLPYVTERWLGGMLTNFSTIRKSLNKLANLDNNMDRDSYKYLAKKEKLMMTRQKNKLKKLFAGIMKETLLPSAIILVDTKEGAIIVKEANKLNIPVFAMIDTNSDPNLIDYPIFSNDDVYQSIELIINYLASGIKEGMQERQDKRKEKPENQAKKDESGILQN